LDTVYGGFWIIVEKGVGYRDVKYTVDGEIDASGQW